MKANTRDEVCQEFGAWNPYANQVPEEVHWRAAEAMADEIVRLRSIVAHHDPRKGTE